MTAPEAPPGAVRYGTPAGRWVLTAAVLGSSLAMLDATIVNVALPALGRDLGSGLSGLQWTVSGYALTLAALLLLGGALGDRYGRRRIFLIGVVWFAVASALCGLAPNVGVLVAARALQGVGGALLTPGSLALLSTAFTGADRARAIGAWSGLGGLASAAGPFVGGALLEISWRLVFLVNLPVAAVVVVLARRHVPESRDPAAAGPLDVPGAVLCAVGLAGVTYALIEAPVRGVGSPAVVSAGVVGVLALVAFGVVERTSRAPMLPLELFRARAFAAANLVTVAVYAALGGTFFLLVVHLQVSVGFTPLAAGAALLPVTAAMLLLSPRAGQLAARIGPRVPMTAGPLVAAVGLLLLRRVGPGSTYVGDVLPAVTVFGLGLALTVAPLTATVLSTADARHAGIASGVNNAVARTAGLLAVAVLPLASGLAELADAPSADPAAFTAGFRTAVLLAAGLLALGGLLAALTVPGAPAPAPARSRACEHDSPPVQASSPLPAAAGDAPPGPDRGRSGP